MLCLCDLNAVGHGLFCISGVCVNNCYCLLACKSKVRKGVVLTVLGHFVFIRRSLTSHLRSTRLGFDSNGDFTKAYASIHNAYKRTKHAMMPIRSYY